ncbi:unnamed protein product [Leptidea sinapis]|uniref:Major facilitator superfamily (MFS) profile domain-containing protein n=1 Tax=Leptidea sinapis TaxID=189913 RepID=A0A5E4PLV7_9NEOP|nr:unnamed protein product [Leptidea sinapis]
MTEINEKNIELDDVLDKFGLFRRYHLKAIALVFLAFVSNAAYCNNFVFTAESVQYRCADSSSYGLTCGNLTQSCGKWVYEDSNSFVAEFQLACQEWKRTLVGSAHSFGYMLGLPLVGFLSDKLGRKTTTILTGVLGGIFGILRSFSLWYWFFITMEFLEAFIGDICSPIYVLSLEMVSSKKRLPFNMLVSLGYPFGGVALGLVAWLSPNWRWTLRILYTPALLFIFYKFCLKESPRWLLSNGKKDKAIDILEEAAECNKIKLDRSMLERISFPENENASFRETLKHTLSSSKLRTRFFVCVVWWMTCTFVNYGLVINSVSLEGNRYMNFILTQLVELPGIFIITYVLIHCKRKKPLILSFLAGGMLCVVHPFIPKDLTWASTTVYMFSKLMSSFYFSITYLYTSELFPTYSRNSMHALCSSLGRTGSILAQQTPLLMIYWKGLPAIVFGSASLIAGLLTLLVPDVAQDSLPDNVSQAEALGKTKGKTALKEK